MQIEPVGLLLKMHSLILWLTAAALVGYQVTGNSGLVSGSRWISARAMRMVYNLHWLPTRK